MESLYLLIPLVLVIVVIAIRVLMWAINSGQYDDLDKEGQRILFDEPEDLGPDALDRVRGKTSVAKTRADSRASRHSAQAAKTPSSSSVEQNQP